MSVFYPHHVVTVSACNSSMQRSSPRPKTSLTPASRPAPSACSYYLASSQPVVPGGLEAVLSQAGIVNVTSIRAQVSTKARGALTRNFPASCQCHIPSPGPHLTSSDTSLHWASHLPFAGHRQAAVGLGFAAGTGRIPPFGLCCHHRVTQRVRCAAQRVDRVGQCSGQRFARGRGVHSDAPAVCRGQGRGMLPAA